jgi:hypothetical protein
MDEESKRKSEKDEESEKVTKSPEFRRLKKLLKHVINAPPLHRAGGAKRRPDRRDSLAP